MKGFCAPMTQLRDEREKERENNAPVRLVEHSSKREKRLVSFSFDKFQRMLNDDDMKLRTGDT